MRLESLLMDGGFGHGEIGEEVGPYSAVGAEHKTHQSLFVDGGFVHGEALVFKPERFSGLREGLLH